MSAPAPLRPTKSVPDIRGLSQYHNPNTGVTTFQARWYDAHGKRQSGTFDTLVEAYNFRQEQLVSRRRGGLANVSGGRTRFDTWQAEWWAERDPDDHIRISTVAVDESYCKTGMLAEFGGRQLNRIEAKDVRDFVKRLQAEGRAPATIQRHLRLLRACLQAAADRGLLPVNPAQGVKGPRVPDKEAEFFEPWEVNALHGAMDPWWRPAVSLIVDASLRIGEAADLRVRHLDFPKRSVSVKGTAAAAPKRLSGEETHRLAHEPKTARGRRNVPMITESTAEELWEMIKDRNLGPDDYLFAGPRGGAMNTNNFRARVWYPTLAAAGLCDRDSDIKSRPSPHALRHTGVSFWIAAGVTDELKLMKWAGHKSTATLRAIYGHLLEEDETEQRRALEDVRRRPTVVHQAPPQWDRGASQVDAVDERGAA